MSILHASDVLPEVISPGRTRMIMHTDHVMMVVVDFNDGPHQFSDPPHRHPHEQITYIADGEVTFFLDGIPTYLKAGDMFSVPPDVPHTVQVLTNNARLIDVFTPIREEFLKK